MPKLNFTTSITLELLATDVAKVIKHLENEGTPHEVRVRKARHFTRKITIYCHDHHRDYFESIFGTLELPLI